MDESTEKAADETTFDPEKDVVDARNKSKLSAHDDPFAPREGKTLVWRDVNMTLAGKGEEPDRKLLTEVWGEVPKQETTAVSDA